MYVKVKSNLALLLAATLSLPFACRAEKFVFVSYSPDIRYSVNGADSKIVLVPKENGYSYGHDFGNLRPCSPKARYCLAFDFMAVAAVPPEARPGVTFSDGEFTFEVGALTDLRVLGATESAYLVTVKKNGTLANRYYFSKLRGVLGIVVLNFKNAQIPESTFFSTSQNGLFHSSQARQEIE